MSGGYESPPELGVTENMFGTWLTSFTSPVLRSRRKTLISRSPVCPGTRLEALLSKATYRPSSLTAGCKDVPEAESEGGWLAGGKEMACKVESRQRSSNCSTASWQGDPFVLPGFPRRRP